jgi:hypothetical protein
MRGSDESRKKVSDTSGGQRKGCPMKTLLGKRRAIKIYAGKPVHLGIKKARA